MSSDGELRSIFRNKLRKNAHWQSVETGLIGPGTPDANCCLNGREFWIEFKQTSGWKPHIRVEQIAWHKTRAFVGGVSFVAIRRWHDGGPRKGDPVDELWICHGIDIGRIHSSGMLDPEITWLGKWDGGPPKWDWEEISRILAQV